MRVIHQFVVRSAVVAVLTGTALLSAVVSAQAQDASAMPRVALTAGRSTVLNTDFDVTRIAVTNPAVADATVVQPREILIDGKAPGTISLIIWGGTRRMQYDIVVEQPISSLEQ